MSAAPNQRTIFFNRILKKFYIILWDLLMMWFSTSLDNFLGFVINSSSSCKNYYASAQRRVLLTHNQFCLFDMFSASCQKKCEKKSKDLHWQVHKGRISWSEHSPRPGCKIVVISQSFIYHLFFCLVVYSLFCKHFIHSFTVVFTHCHSLWSPCPAWSLAKLSQKSWISGRGQPAFHQGD